MDIERLLAAILFGVLHWVLAIMLLQDLARREHVRGGHKAPWALAILLVIYLGSVAYIISHPDTIYGRNEE